MTVPPFRVPSYPPVPSKQTEGADTPQWTPPPWLDPEKVVDSCIFRSAMSAGAGGLFGFAFGAMFGGTHNPADYENTPMRKQVLEGFKQSGKAGWSGMKNFAAVGGLYSLTECYLEQFRAKSDHWNTLMAGCFSGGLVAGRAGPHAAALGCATFAGFSYAIDYFLGRHHESTKVKHPDKYD